MIDFEKALVTLDDARVQFIIVGGLAVTIHGSCHVTFDLDSAMPATRRILLASRTSYNLIPLDFAVRPQTYRFDWTRRHCTEG